jgi:hypothetical protein
VKIVVHIDRLVLDGVGQPDLPRLQAALEQELAHALASGGGTFGRRAEATPVAGALVDVTRGPEAIGQAIARAARAHIAAAHTSAASPDPAATPSPLLGAEART